MKKSRKSTFSRIYLLIAHVPRGIRTREIAYDILEGRFFVSSKFDVDPSTRSRVLELQTDRQKTYNHSILHI